MFSEYTTGTKFAENHTVNNAELGSCFWDHLSNNQCHNQMRIDTTLILSSMLFYNTDIEAYGIYNNIWYFVKWCIQQKVYFSNMQIFTSDATTD